MSDDVSRVFYTPGQKQSFIRGVGDSVGVNEKDMKFNIRRVAQATNLAAAGLLVVKGFFLVTAPLHPDVGDSHRGLMAVFPGALLWMFALLIHTICRWLIRLGDAGSLIAVLASVAVIVTVLALQSEH